MAYSNNTQATNTTTYNIEIISAKIVRDSSVTFTMKVNDVMIYECWMNERTRKDGTKFDCISLPSRKGSDGKYYSYVYIPLRELSDEIIRKVKSLL